MLSARSFIPAILVLLTLISGVDAQSITDSLFKDLEYRCVGPFRGGRSAAVAGVPGKPFRFYFGATGGGVWQTDNGGKTWKSISDGFFGGSIGAVAVSEWDPNVIYVGGGEKTVRGNVSHGFGMWKSQDAGLTWRQIGLKDTRHIPRIRIHPKNPDLVYAAAMGHLYGPNRQRGVFRSSDGGKTWQNILFVSEKAGAVELVMHPANPRILYASFWQIKRTPYSLESGGKDSGIWKSTDGGDTWKNITRSKGLPQGIIGISGVTISPVKPERLWAIIEAKDGGVFRSDDHGKTWRKINQERKLRQRAWYYTRIYADTQNEDMVYVLNVRFWQSKDGGKSFSSIRTPHGDHHDLWIDPDDPRRMVIGDDGGAQVTYDRGKSWSTYHNQPTAQFYRVATDNHFPYRIYGGQQDNSTVRIEHRSDGRNITERNWEATAGGESGHLAIHPENPDIVYGGSYGGFLTRVDHRNSQIRVVDVWPDNPMGYGAGALTYRFQWNFPIFFSPHNADILYAAGNVLFKSSNAGQSWTAISPDLTRNDSTRLGSSGGPITKDNTSVEYYCTIFAAAESQHEKDVLWAGSDDGLIHISRDGGAHWTNVTPAKKLMPEWIQINSIEIDPFNAGGLYVAATAYKSDDFQPYLYKTVNYGKSWTRIDRGIDRLHFTRVIRADPGRQGLLYAGTESGMYISFNDGKSWQPFQLNLPEVPITDLAVKNNDLVVATQGRSFWVLDDLTPLHQMPAALSGINYRFFKPRDSYRLRGGGNGSLTAGKNAPNGVLLNYYFDKQPDSAAVSLKVMEKDGKVIKTFSPKDKDNRLPLKQGFNRFVWNMRYPDAEKFKGLILWFNGLTGPKAVPGQYKARLIVGRDSTGVDFTILKDPRSESSIEDLQAQFDFLMSIVNKVGEVHKTIKDIRSAKDQMKAFVGRLNEDITGQDSLKAAAKRLTANLEKIEQQLYQTKNESRQDPLNFPIRLNNKLSILNSLMSIGDYRPTDQAIAVRDELVGLIDPALAEVQRLFSEEVAAFNALVREFDVPAVIVK